MCISETAHCFVRGAQCDVLTLRSPEDWLLLAARWRRGGPGGPSRAPPWQPNIASSSPAQPAQPSPAQPSQPSPGCGWTMVPAVELTLAGSWPLVAAPAPPPAIITRQQALPGPGLHTEDTRRRWRPLCRNMCRHTVAPCGHHCARSKANNGPIIRCLSRPI